jgi:glucosylceramidase
VLADPQAGPLIKGVGVQWAGKGALEDIQREYPQVPIWASEQECGTGTNDWHYSRYCWTMMRRYFAAGARAWHYWNMAMPLGGMSGWGWPQNALVSVDSAKGTYSLTNDYWMLRHVSALVAPGAHYIPATSFLGFENQMAFRNPNGDLVIVVENETAEPLPIGFAIRGKLFRPTLPCDSINTMVIPAAMLV